jgi:hypothetical protein
MSKHGIVLYDIQMDGCLNGVYTNEPAHGVIYNEIARKQKPSSTPDKWDIEGDYDCMWFDELNSQENCILRITQSPTDPPVFKVEWLDTITRNPRFSGIGYYMNPRQFAVRSE